LGETRNLAGERPELVAQMQKLLAEIESNGRSRP